MKPPRLCRQRQPYQRHYRPRGRKAEIVASRVANVAVGGNHARICKLLLHQIHSAVAGGVVHDDDLERKRRVTAVQTAQAGANHPRTVVGDDDDGKLRGGRRSWRLLWAGHVWWAGAGGLRCRIARCYHFSSE